MTAVVANRFDSLLKEISTNLDKAEAADVVYRLQRLYSSDSFDQKDLHGALRKLLFLGAINEDGDIELLKILVEKTSKKDQVLKSIDTYKESTSALKRDFVGRDVNVEELRESLTRDNVSGVNLYGESGVGKTTLAKEVSKQMKDFETIFIDLRDIKAIEKVFSQVLLKLGLPAWDKNKERICEHLENVPRSTILIFDSIEQILKSEDSQTRQETRSKFLEFLKVIIANEASKKGHLKVILTSTTQINDPRLKGKLFTEDKVQPFSKDVSKDFITGKVKKDASSCEQDATLFEIVELCRNKPYLLQTAEQLMRERYTSPVDVLRKITTQTKNGVPKKFACIKALFDSLPSDHLRQLAVKISLLRRPFSVSTAMKIAEISSDYDARWDLEMLVNHKIITAEDVEGKRKYDLHALFREFVTSHLCEKDSVYKEQLKKGEDKFAEHFSGKLTTLARKLESEFVKTYSKLEGNRANFELAIELSQNNLKEAFDLLLHTDDPNQFAIMGILFEVLKDEKERRKLFGEWADAAERQGQWFTSALMRCWQSIQGSDVEGTSNEKILEKAEASIDKLQSVSPEKLKDLKSLFLHCRGKVKWMRAEKMNAEQKRRKKKLLEEGIDDLQQAVDMRRKLSVDSTLTSRALNLIGNCYMGLEDPLSARKYYQKAMDVKKKLVGSENHWEFPTYYNQIAIVHEMVGREEEEKWYNRVFGLKKKARKEYEEAVEWMQKALKLQVELGVSDTLYTAFFQRNLANILIGLGEYDQALEYAQESYKIRSTRLGIHPETIRILYVIGIIHEWRKDHKAALQSYEEAFEMEESLPADNHSVVRKKLCNRLEAMCRKLKKKDKLKEYAPRTKRIRKIKDVPWSPQHSSKDPLAPFLQEDDDDDGLPLIVDKAGGSYHLLRRSVFLDFLPNTVTKRTEVTCKLHPEGYSPSPANNDETLVSNIVELGPKDVDICQPIAVALVHAGPSRDLGYETIVKIFNQDKHNWQEIKGTEDVLYSQEQRPSIQVKISKLTSLAVISRLITDSFEVTPDKGCVARSSVCVDVTVEFPEGAVNKTVNGTIKLLLIPKSLSFKEYDVCPCPVLVIQGLEDCTFQKYVTVQVPHPCPEAVRETRVFCHKDGEWVDITDDIEIIVHDSLIQFKVQHFSKYWVLVIASASTAFVTGVMVGRMYDYVLRQRNSREHPAPSAPPYEGDE